MAFVSPKTFTAYAFTEQNGKLQKVRSVWYATKQDVDIWEQVSVDWKDPERNQVVVQVLACGVCHRYWSPRMLLPYLAECLLVRTATPSSRPAFGAFRIHGSPGTRYFGVTVAWGLL
jgi:hypothetical protein